MLGTGATATLAAWTDGEVATGTFGTSVFDTVSTSAGTTVGSHPTAPGASLTFAATAMSPGVSAYAWLNVNTTAATTISGSMSLTLVKATDTSGVALSTYLQYRIVQLATASTTCAAASFTGSPTWVTPANTYTNVAAALPTTTAIALASGGTAEKRLCIEVQLAPTATSDRQGQTANIQWTFTATSTS
ncbi:hypothetical protein GCM10022198_22870 [Klugiella xanthotipulae]|uniref:Putative ribosomally synthesized peptide with SipW-like signal peptide n=1 Tax=Klugiella xanthotipulae TaxID=244735 RepID=A0A543HYB7_9MICO|nr:putative ribosomally synthesized peptide with SipW-like signal peptide [Klugiella xanthotipulae]